MCISFGPPTLDVPEQLYRTTSIRAQWYVCVCAHASHTTVGYNIISNNEKSGAQCLLTEVWRN